MASSNLLTVGAYVPWVKLDDHFSDHPKLHRVGAIGLAIQTAAICFCGRHLTDGKLSFADADSMIRSVLSPITDDEGAIWSLGLTSGVNGRDADEFDWKQLMVEAGLWDKMPTGFRVHDYLEYNPSKKEYTESIEAKRHAGKAGGQASAQARAQAQSKPVPVPVSQDLKIKPSSVADRDGFESFWSIYPRNRRKEKPTAKAAFREARKKADLETILRALRADVASEDWEKDEGKFIPYPAKWLKRERWLDLRPWDGSPTLSRADEELRKVRGEIAQREARGEKIE